MVGRSRAIRPIAWHSLAPPVRLVVPHPATLVTAVNPALADALRDRYSIERELGRGGMATVYLAQDLRHTRRVAIKVLRPELALALGPERFLQEIKLAAGLQHPNVLPVFDSGEAEGQLWYAMPYVEGESLREWLAREKQLAVEEALRLTHEVADALDYAHDQGLVHRDIKPENILLSHGHALLTDFGIAQAVQRQGDERLTETGLTVGTPAYMSPEQAAGERHLDRRTDLYSLAVVLYEMLTGEPPYAGPTAQAVSAKRLGGQLPPVRRVRPTVPDSVEAVITKALAPVPADRFATAGEFASALTRSAGTSVAPGSPVSTRRRQAFLAFTALTLGLMGAWGIFISRQGVHETRSHEVIGPRRLAVIPFQNLGDSTDGYFAEGITDEIRGKLASVPGLEVIARASSEQYQRTPKSPAEIGRELNVEYLLTGTVRWAKGGGTSRVRVSPELVRAGTGATTWQEPFEAPLTDVFQVQADIADRVARALDQALGDSVRRDLIGRRRASASASEPRVDWVSGPVQRTFCPRSRLVSSA